MTTRELRADLASRISIAAKTIRRIIGAPDYDAYVEHHRRFHPTCTTLSRKEFVQQRLEDRYSRPGSRCC